MTDPYIQGTQGFFHFLELSKENIEKIDNLLKQDDELLTQSHHILLKRKVINQEMRIAYTVMSKLCDSWSNKLKY